MNSNLITIEDNLVKLELLGQEQKLELENDLVYIFAGGELPTQFLKSAGIAITQKFGEALLKHKKR